MMHDDLKHDRIDALGTLIEKRFAQGRIETKQLIGRILTDDLAGGLVTDFEHAAAGRVIMIGFKLHVLVADESP